MKKYIRTKDTDFRTGEILKVLHEYEDYFECEGTFEKRIGCKAYVKKEIVVKSADTIEELCDEFVDTSELKTSNTGEWLYDEFDNKNKCLVYYAKDERRTIPLNEFDDLSKIYGAIFTDKGLIYVAKMNEKGELELL